MTAVGSPVTNPQSVAGVRVHCRPGLPSASLGAPQPDAGRGGAVHAAHRAGGGLLPRHRPDAHPGRTPANVALPAAAVTTSRRTDDCGLAGHPVSSDLLPPTCTGAGFVCDIILSNCIMEAEVFEMCKVLMLPPTKTMTATTVCRTTIFTKGSHGYQYHIFRNFGKLHIFRPGMWGHRARGRILLPSSQAGLI